MHQDSEPGPSKPPVAPSASSGDAEVQAPKPTASTGGVTSILRTASPLPRIATSSAQDPANTSTEGLIKARSDTGHSDHHSLNAHPSQELTKSPTGHSRRRLSFADRGPYDHDASAFVNTSQVPLQRGSPPLPALPPEAALPSNNGRPPPLRQGSGLEWIVPEVVEKTPRKKSIEDRLRPTMDTAQKEKDKFARKAFITGWSLNVAIGLQLLLGTLVTGLSATGTSSLGTSILGGLSTLVASYLARARGSNEPELSIVRTKDLEQFSRQCEAFIMDYGPLVTNDHDEEIDNFRRRLEEILGNVNQERKLSPPA